MMLVILIHVSAAVVEENCSTASLGEVLYFCHTTKPHRVIDVLVADNHLASVCSSQLQCLVMSQETVAESNREHLYPWAHVCARHGAPQPP